MASKREVGQKGSKPQRYDLIPYDALDLVAEHFGRGADKYGARNWELGFDWGLSEAALGRHFSGHMQGEALDEEGNSHLAAVAWHALCLLAYELRGVGTDSRS